MLGTNPREEAKLVRAQASLDALSERLAADKARARVAESLNPRPLPRASTFARMMPGDLAYWRLAMSMAEQAHRAASSQRQEMPEFRNRAECSKWAAESAVMYLRARRFADTFRI